MPNTSVRRISLSSLRSSSSALGLKSATSAADAHRPARRVPLPDRRDRRPAGARPREDLGRRLAGAADRAGAGDDDALHGSIRQPPEAGRPSTSSGLRRTMQLFEPPKPNELDSATRTRRRRGSPRTTSRSQSGSSSRRFALTGSVAVPDRERADRRLDRAGRRDQVPHHALRRADRDPLRARAEHRVDRRALAAVVHRRRGAVRVQVVHLVEPRAGVGERLAHRLDRPVADGCESVMR